MNTAAKKVIVVFKTHLDIGFTGLAQQVLDKYCLDFIPSAVELAFRVNTPQYKKICVDGGLLSHPVLFCTCRCGRLQQAGTGHPAGICPLARTGLHHAYGADGPPASGL